MDFTQLAQFQSKQLDAWFKLFDPECKYLLYGGAAGGGKSYFLRWAAVGLGMYYASKYKIEGAPIGLFSEDYPTLKDRQIRRIKLEMPEWLGTLKESKDEGLVFKSHPKWGGWVILLRNLDDPSKYASAEFCSILVEELTKNDKDTFDDLRFRLRYPGVPDPKFIGATNPGSIGHGWVKKLWINPDPKDPDGEQHNFFYIPALVHDNEYIDKSYVNQLSSLPEQKRKAFLEGSWDIFAGQVFTEWAEIAHVVEPFEIPDFWNRYMSMDYGVNKPFSVNWYAVNEDGRVYKYRELYLNGEGFEEKFGKSLTPKRLARILVHINRNNNEKIRGVYSDPSVWNRAVSGKPRPGETEGESIAETMIREGLPLIKGDNDRINGLERYREMLSVAPDGLPWYQVFRNCYDTIRTIPSMVYDEHKVEDVDTDGEDHVYDADRYFFMSRPSKSKETEERADTPLARFYRRKTKQYNQVAYG